MEAHALRPLPRARPPGGAESAGGVGGAKRGATEGEIILKYLDESGFSLCLAPAYTAGRRRDGLTNERRVPTQWGRQGRINLVGTLRSGGEDEGRLEYRLLEGSCRTGEVIAYLDALAEEAGRRDEPTVVVLDNAPFHTAGAVREREPGWEANGLVLYRLPAYCPHLNPIEGVWRKLKGS